MRMLKRLMTICLSTLVSGAAIPLLPTMAYSSADINRDNSVDILDSTALNQCLWGSLLINDPKVLDVDGNHVVSFADADAALAKSLNKTYYNEVNGSSTMFQVNNNTSYFYQASNAHIYDYYYAHSCDGSFGDFLYSLDLRENPGRSVIGQDTRQPETDPDIRSGVCRLDKDNGIYLGTGFVVGDHVIATAAHCLTEWNNGFKYYENVYAQFPSANSSTVNLNSTKYYAKEIHIPFDYKHYAVTHNGGYGGSPNDYALITVEEDLSDCYHFPLGVAYDFHATPFTNFKIYVSGYPQVVNGQSVPNWNVLYSDWGTMYPNATHTDRLEYNTDTSSGQSGGPVYIKEKYKIYSGATCTTSATLNTVVGIHVLGGNEAALITPIRLKFFLNNEYISY